VTTYVLDANAVLEYAFQGARAPEVRDLLKKSAKTGGRLLISAVQVGEIHAEVARRRGLAAADETLRRLEDLGFQFEEFNSARATAASRLRLQTGLVFADSAAAALALECNAVLVTGDPDLKRAEGRVKIHWLK
jgi:predicted nucleic acid-binding protein